MLGTGPLMITAGSVSRGKERLGRAGNSAGRVKQSPGKA